MKHCKKCSTDKDESEFGKDRQKKDGFNLYCKECIKKRGKQQRKNDPQYAKKYRNENRELLRERGRFTYERDKEKRLQQSKESYYRHKESIAKRRKIKRSTPEARAKQALRQKEWRHKNKKKFGTYVRKWQTSNRERANAHAKVNRAVTAGRLKRSMKCQECGLECKTEGHHEDYSKPLIVVWLCRKCHASKLQTVEV
jgi:hypothetical protein